MKPVRFISLPLLVILAIGCAQLKPQSEPEAEAEGVILPSEGVAPPVVFPHLEGWRDPKGHGQWVSQFGRTPCLQCHLEGSDQGGAIPTCRSCHPLFPHWPGWVDPSNHGRWVEQKGNSCGTNCHGADFNGGLSGVSCNDCHEIYPHPPDWREPAVHGEIARTEGKPLCRACHGEDLRGATSGVSCYQCHAPYPHSENWREPRRHGVTVVQNGTAGCRTACHGSNLEGGLSGVSCSRCHDVYPHPAGWSAGLQHGSQALQDIDSCKSCHGIGLNRSPTGGPTCQGCHPSLLRHPQAAMVTADPDWGSPAGHGRYFLDLPDHDETSECQLCHGEDLRGGISNKSCTSCHPAFPHPAGWGNPTGEQSHTSFVRENGFSFCRTACHGSDFRGGISRISCGAAGCHQTFPHDASWKNRGNHDRSFVEQLAHGKTRPCLGCHGEDYRGGPSQVSCDRCHRLSHIPGEWGNFSSHGAAYRGDQEEGADRCSRCHGAPVGFNDTYSGLRPVKQIAPVCSGCHPAYPHISYRTSQTYPWKGENGAAHIRFINRNRSLLTGSSLDDPALVDSIQETCGNGGGCHTDGRFSSERDNTSAACSAVCHSP